MPKLSPSIQKLVDQAEAAERRGRAKPKRASSRKAPAKRRGNPGPRGHREPADPHAARELELYIENESDLSPWGPRGQGREIAKNLARKMRSGKYDPAKAPKLWAYLAEAGAKRYAKEFGIAREWARTFTPATRELVAVSLARDFEDRFKAGDWTG
jgi:hypothetical protein